MDFLKRLEETCPDAQVTTEIGEGGNQIHIYTNMSTYSNKTDLFLFLRLYNAVYFLSIIVSNTIFNCRMFWILYQREVCIFEEVALQKQMARRRYDDGDINTNGSSK